MNIVERVQSRQVYANRSMTVREDTVRYTDGSTAVCTVVNAGDIALVVPVDGDRLHLVEQYRYPVDGRRWEFPSGNVELGLDDEPADAAARELREETGLLTSDVTELGIVEITPSTSTQRCHVFLATHLTEGSPRTEPAEEDMRSAWFPRAVVQRMISDGVITDAKSCAAFALLLAHEAPLLV